MEYWSVGVMGKNVVPTVQAVQVVQTPSFILPRAAGEERGEGFRR
jgi:hypothetical protein